jgi:hypothetical protein
MKTICIEAKDDGTYSVYEESARSEAAEIEMPGTGGPAEVPGEAEQGAQTAQSVDEALDLARQMLQDDGRSEEQQMQAGYQRGRPMAGGMTPAKVMGMGA